MCDRTARHLLRGDYAAALKDLQGVASSGEGAAGRENVRGVALLMSGDFRGAVQAFDRAIELEPKSMEARFNRAVALLKLNDLAKASAEFERVTGLGGALQASAAYHNAIALDRLGKRREAEQWLERAIAHDASFHAAILYRGILQERRGDLQAAGKSYLQLLNLVPDSVVATLRFGVAAQRSGHPETAAKYLRRVIQLAPQSAEAGEARKHLVMWE